MARELRTTLVVETGATGAPGTIYTGSIEPEDTTVVLLEATVLVLPNGGHDAVTIQGEQAGDNGMFFDVGSALAITDTQPHMVRIDGIIGAFIRLRVTLSSDASSSVGAALEVALLPMREARPMPVRESRGLSSLFQAAVRNSGGRIRVVPER